MVRLALAAVWEMGTTTAVLLYSAVVMAEDEDVRCGVAFLQE